MKNSKYWAVFVLGAVGCGSSSPQTHARNAEPLPAIAIAQEAPAAITERAECTVREVYFGYDSSELSEEARQALQDSVRCLQERRAERVRLTGMADPRGTEEYNLALGERRAKTTAQYVSSLGLASVETHSTGEEFARGIENGTWSRDRRVEFSQ